MKKTALSLLCLMLTSVIGASEHVQRSIWGEQESSKNVALLYNATKVLSASPVPFFLLAQCFAEESTGRGLCGCGLFGTSAVSFAAHIALLGQLKKCKKYNTASIATGTASSLAMLTSFLLAQKDKKSKVVALSFFIGLAGGAGKAIYDGYDYLAH